ncbi:hypothetical protein ZWY2020_029577 [Hordeum vulgare]|nr:hypothetical protein ZWY2020_029577 [Hordeum vulgare]
MYRSNGSLLCGAASTGWVESRALSSTNAASTSSFHSNTSDFFISRYKGSAFSPRRDINRLNAARHSISFCMSCTRTGLCIRTMAPCIRKDRTGSQMPSSECLRRVQQARWLQHEGSTEITPDEPPRASPTAGVESDRIYMKRENAGSWNSGLEKEQILETYSAQLKKS